jgi:hypothetical protein
MALAGYMGLCDAFTTPWGSIEFFLIFILMSSGVAAMFPYPVTLFAGFWGSFRDYDPILACKLAPTDVLETPAFFLYGVR